MDNTTSDNITSDAMTDTGDMAEIATTALSDLAALVRGWENAHESRIDKDQYIIMRLDGHTFSSWTKGFAKPSDERINLALVLTTLHLVDTFHARMGYCQSDEITLILPPAIPHVLEGQDSARATATTTTNIDRKEIAQPVRLNPNALPSHHHHAYDGRIEKLCSLAASTATARFNLCMNAYADNEMADLKPNVRERIRSCTAVFDCRVFAAATPEDAAKAVLWRHQDCRRNAVMACAQAVFPHKKLHGRGAGKALKMMKEELGWDPTETRLDLLAHDAEVLNTMKTTVMMKNYDENRVAGDSPKAEGQKALVNKNVSIQFMYGAFVKKELYLRDAVDQKTKAPNSVMRTRVTARSFQWAGTNEELGWMAVRKYW
ncbi:tRNAHis guanylyltransferase-domain-containing protein [Endogone sp. FLAS-F59071]|nr:tRNAHis guanylyltransferase-domain-containing protein [Endogone sp. FLAS-F59071]|eukprot:RUS20011.1 tRNAHis guanylyltransferase-domain-containing protein [Endogone sp. FLAS-F59071]